MLLEELMMGTGSPRGVGLFAPVGPPTHAPATSVCPQTEEVTAGNVPGHEAILRSQAHWIVPHIFMAGGWVYHGSTLLA